MAAAAAAAAAANTPAADVGVVDLGNEVRIIDSPSILQPGGLCLGGLGDLLLRCKVPSGVVAG